MIAIKLMRQGHSWIGDMHAPAVPRVREIVYLADGNSYEVMEVAYELNSSGTHDPFVILSGDPRPKAV